MKVWEKCNEVKGTDADVQEIADWAYNNRFCPLMFDVGLDIDVPLDEDGYPVENGFLKTAEGLCDGKCGWDCLIRYLYSEYEEVQG